MFKFTKENGDNRCVSDGVKNIWTTPLVIDDTPGAENLLESYIFNNSEINQNYLEFIKYTKGQTDMKKWIEDDKKMHENLKKQKSKSSIEMFNWPNVNKKSDSTWAFAMLCAGLIDPLWLGCLNSTGVFKGYNQLLNNTTFWNDFTLDNVMEEYKEYMKENCYECYKIKLKEGKLNLRMVNIIDKECKDDDCLPYCRKFEPPGYQERIFNYKYETES